MENGVERESGAAVDVVVFSEEEVREISGLKRGDDYVEVTCGCTSHRYGDAVGRLRVFVTGDLEITCECTPGCQEDKMTPAAFEKHSGRETARKWKNNVWVILSGEKVPLFKTPLLKYYNQASKGANGSHRSHNGRVCHRDEFVRCSRCGRERRFRLRNKEECRIYHDALADVNWTCDDMPYDNLKEIDDQIVMMMRNELVAGCIGAVPDLQHAEVAPHACVLDVRSVVFQIATARLALTSLGMRKLKRVSKTVFFSPNVPSILDGTNFEVQGG
ncbi:unnamed protein product [Camellia sinensis]